jgi:RHS repeat-associated protein
MKPNVVEACIASADNVPCHDMTLAKQGGSDDITAQDHTGCSKFDFVEGFELACGLYPWTIYKNLGGGQFALEDPETILQPIPLESDTGDTSLTAGGYVGQQQSIIDIDGDGFLDVMIRGRWVATGLPPGTEPFWWWGFLGDGLGGFVKDPATGIHEQHFFQVHEEFDLSENVRSWVTPYSSYLVSSVEQLADMNGDGSIDMLRHFPSIEEGDPGSLHLHFNDGLSMRWTETLGPDRVLAEPLAAATRSHFVVTDSDGTDPNKRYIIDATRDARNRLIDVDEDGRADLYQMSSEGPQIFHNVGGDVAGPVLAAAEMRPGLAQKMVTEGENWATKSDLLDLDGDGIPESIDFAAFEQAKYDPDGSPPRLLTQVSNGRGATTAIVYAPLSDTDVVENSPASTSDPTSVASPRTQWVVASVETSDTFESTTSKTIYFYDDPVFNADDEGRFAFRGFKTVKTEGPRGDLTIQRYGFDDVVSPDWSGRLIETVTMLEADVPATVHSIARQSWTENSLFGGALKTYHPLDARTYRCKPSQTEAACEADPAGFVLSRSSWAPKAAGGTDLLYIENETTTQDSEAFDDGDRKITRQFDLFTTGDVYRLRETKTESFEQVSSVDVLYASTETVWDSSYRVPSETKRLLDGLGTLAITEQGFDLTTGNLETVRKPEQVEANSSLVSTSSYDSRKLFVADVVNELGHSNQRDYEYGTGAVIEERGPNHPNCPDPPVGCPASGLPERDGQKTKVDGFGRPLEVEVTSMYPGYPQVFQWSKVEAFAYTDAPAGGVPAYVVDSKRINFDEDRWTSVRTDMDGHGRPIKTTEKTYGTTSVDAITTYDYDADGKLIAVAVPDPSVNTSAQVTFTYSFDSIGRPTGMRRPDSTDVNQRSGIDVSYSGLVETRLEVPGAGGQTSGQAPAMSKLESDAFGRLIKVSERVSTGPDVFAETTYAFSPRDEVKTIVSVAGQPDGVTTELEHDLGGRRTAITRGDRTWRYEYDRNDNLIVEAAPSPNPGHEPTDAAWTSTFAYDALDRMTSKAIAQRDLSEADRDLFGATQAILEWDGNGLNGFNRVGRLVFYDTQGPSEETVFRGRLYYDPEGQLRIDDREFTIPVSGGTVTFPYRKETYKFDPFGKIRTVINADETGSEESSSVQTRYDDRGNPEDVLLVRPGMTAKAAAIQTRNVAGLVTKRKSNQSGVGMTFVESVWAYDKLGRVTSQTVQKNGTPSEIARQDLTYWGNDDPKSLDHWIGSTNHKKFEYSYDQRHQLVGVSETAAGGAFAASYQFGRAGRFTDATVTPTALTGREVRPRNVRYVYGSADPEIVTELETPIGGGQYAPYAEYEYDSVGNQTVRRYFTDASLPTPQTLGTPEQWDFVYDGEDQLRRVTTPGTNGVIEEYWYNHEGNRALVRTRPKSGSGPITWRWFHNHTEVEWQTDDLTDTTATQGQTIAYAVMGTPVARILDRNDRTEFQFHGLASSTLATVESGSGVLESGDPTPPASGTTNTAFIYSPFGELVESAGAEAQTHRRRLNDKYQDTSSGLTYYGFRYYDNVGMMWTQADPLYRFEPDAAWTEPRRASLYTFDQQNPLRYADPDGRDGVLVGTATGCALGGPPGCVVGAGVGAVIDGLLILGTIGAGALAGAVGRPWTSWMPSSPSALTTAVASAAAATATATISLTTKVPDPPDVPPEVVELPKLPKRDGQRGGTLNPRPRPDPIPPARIVPPKKWWDPRTWRSGSGPSSGSGADEKKKGASVPQEERSSERYTWDIGGCGIECVIR